MADLPPGWTIERYDEFARESGGMTYAERQAQNAEIQAQFDRGEIKPAEALPELDSDDPDYERDPNEMRDERDEAAAWVEAHPEVVQRHARRLQRARRQAQDADAASTSSSAHGTRRRAAPAAAGASAAPPAAAAAAASIGRRTRGAAAAPAAPSNNDGDRAMLDESDLRELMDSMGPTEAAIDERVAEMRREAAATKAAARRAAARTNSSNSSGGGDGDAKKKPAGKKGGRKGK